MKFTLISWFLLMVISSVCGEIKVRGTEGEQVFLNCPYADGYENSYKYFYKGPVRDNNLILKSDGGASSVSEGRFSLRDDHQKRLLMLIIRNLSMTDAGEYSCGAGWWGEYKNIKLNVIRAPQKTRPVQISTSTLHSYTHTSTDHSSTVTPQTGRETTRTITESTAVQLNQPNTSSFVILITAEALFLLLIGLPLIIVAVWKKKKNKGLLSSSVEEFNPVIYEQHFDDDEEEDCDCSDLQYFDVDVQQLIKDAGRQCNPEDRDTETTVVYSCAS